jgi:hypothetical protein
MTENQLSRVADFTIKNSSGKIEFLKPVDLRGVDID